MGIALVDGSSGHYARIRDLAWGHLPAKYRIFYRCASAWPGLARRTYPGEAADRDARPPRGRESRGAGRPLSVLAAIGVLAIAVMAFGAIVILLRHRAYCWWLLYDPRQNCILGMAGPDWNTIPVQCFTDGFSARADYQSDKWSPRGGGQSLPCGTIVRSIYRDHGKKF